MKEIILSILILQVVSLIYGLSVLKSIKPIVENILKEKGYVLKDKNVIDEFTDNIIKILTVFIPFYHAYKAYDIVSKKNPIKKAVREEIKSGNYILMEDLKVDEDDYKEVDPQKVRVYTSNADLIEAPSEKYKAVKNNFVDFDKPMEEFKSEIIENKKVEELSPFITDNSIIKESKEEMVSKSAIAKAITELNISELEMLNDRISELATYKKNTELLLEKDVA